MFFGTKTYTGGSHHQVLLFSSFPDSAVTPGWPCLPKEEVVVTFKGGYFLSDSDADGETSDDRSVLLDSGELDPTGGKLRRKPEEDESPIEEDEEDIV